MVVFPQDPHEIVGDENGVVVPHYEPPHVLEPKTQRLGDDPRYPNRGTVPLFVSVREPRGVAGDFNRREAEAFRVFILYLAVQPNYASHRVGLVPELDVVLPLFPKLGGGGNAEYDVVYLRRVVFVYGLVGFELENLGRPILDGCDVGGGGGGGGEADGVKWVIFIGAGGSGGGDELERVDDVSERDAEDEPDEEFRGGSRLRTGSRNWGPCGAPHLIPNYFLLIFLARFHFSQAPL